CRRIGNTLPEQVERTVRVFPRVVVVTTAELQTREQPPDGCRLATQLNWGAWPYAYAGIKIQRMPKAGSRIFDSPEIGAAALTLYGSEPLIGVRQLEKQAL